jgi:hypothetical protein
MKLLYLPNDFDLSDSTALSISPEIVTQPNPNDSQEKPRYTPVIALIVLFVFAGFSLTIPLHPARSAVPNGCSTSIALPPGESAATCIMQATTKDNSARGVEKSAEIFDMTLVNGQVISVQFAKKVFSRVVRSNLITEMAAGLNNLPV